MTPDEIDLLVEQVKMLAGEVAFSMSTLKRLVDQSVNDPENSQTQVVLLLIFVYSATGNTFQRYLL